MKRPYNPNIILTSLRLLLLCCCFIPTAYAAQRAGGNLVFPRSRSANIGIIIRDLATGKDVVSRNPDKFLTPASILKCVTAAALLLDDKETDRFLTESFITGHIDSNGTLLGNVVIKGVGDPTTESPLFPEYCGMPDSISSRLRMLGVRKICGTIEIDSLLFREQGPISKWEVEDLKWYYGAGLYPVNYHDNTASADRSITHPDNMLIRDLENSLNHDSIAVNWQKSDLTVPSAKMIYVHESPMASQIMRVMIEKSNNLYAESMLRFLKPEGNLADALDRERALLSDAGLNCDDLIAFDGSGLTRNSKLTPDFMADLLETMANGRKASSYLSFFPRAGVEGTVKKFLKGTRLEGQLLLKSGSMNGVQCFAGYKLNQENIPTHVVVIMVNDFICKRAYVTKAISDMLLKQF